jgi:hypothetical protein
MSRRNSSCGEVFQRGKPQEEEPRRSEGAKKRREGRGGRRIGDCKLKIAKCKLGMGPLGARPSLRAAPSPGTPGEGRGEGASERKRSMVIPKRVHCGYERPFAFEITLTPTLSRSTGRGGSSAQRRSCTPGRSSICNLQSLTPRPQRLVSQPLRFSFANSFFSPGVSSGSVGGRPPFSSYRFCCRSRIDWRS